MQKRASRVAREVRRLIFIKRPECDLAELAAKGRDTALLR